MTRRSRTLTALFQIDCALRELRRELDHRPTWIEVPIRALLNLVGQASA